MRQIKSLHERLNKSVAYVYKDSQETRIKMTIGRGITNRMAEKEKKVYEEVILLEKNGDKVSRVECYFEQLDAHSLQLQARKVVNDSVGSDEVDQIEVIYQDDAGTQSYKVGEMKAESLQLDLLRLYRDYLLTALKEIEYKEQRRRATENYQINTILQMGSSNK